MTELTLRQDETALAAAVSRFSDAPGLRAQTADTSGLDLDIVSDVEGFHALEDDWTRLVARLDRPEHVFQTYAWCWHWCRHYLSAKGDGPRLAIVTGRSGGRLVLVLPLIIERRAGLRQLGWMGDPVSQYGDILAAPEAAVPETLARAWAFAVARSRADVANLRKVRAGSLAATMLRSVGAVVTAVEEAPWIDLTKSRDFAAFDAAVPAKGRRKNRRRHMRRLEERGPIEIESHAGTDDAASLADYAICLKRAWLKDKDYISPALVDDRFTAFFADVVHGRGKPAGAKVMTLRSAGEVAALDIVVDHAGARFLHVAVFSSKFEKCGVGGLLLESAIEGCYRDGIRTFDLLAPKHDYKLDFTEESMLVEDFALALTWKGRAWLDGFLAFRRRLKAMIERMPPPVRRAVAAGLAIAKRRR